MRDTSPTFRDIMFIGVAPTLAAMLVGAAILTERLQTDLTGESVKATNSFWLLCPFTFGLLHIIGTGVLPSASSNWINWISRSAKAGLFFMLHTPWFWFGAAYFALMSLPFLAVTFSKNIFGDIRPPFVPEEAFGSFLFALTVLSAGIGYGLLLAILSAPNWRGTSKQGRQRLLMAYVVSGTLASVAYYYTSEYVAAYSIGGTRNPLHEAQYAWLITLIVSIAIMTGCLLIWTAALRVYLPRGNLITSRAYAKGICVLLAATICFASLTHYAVSDRITLLGDNIDLEDRLANFIRSHQPLIPRPSGPASH